MRTPIRIFLPGLSLAFVLAALMAGPLAAQLPCGDCNLDGSITILDSLAVEQHFYGITPIIGPKILNCDVNGNGAIDLNDSSLIANAAASGQTGMLSCLPCGDCSSSRGVGPGFGPEDYSFALDHFLGTGVLGTPLTDSAFAACDTDVGGFGYYTVVGNPDNIPWSFFVADLTTGLVMSGGPVQVAMGGGAPALANAWVNAINNLPDNNFGAIVTPPSDPFAG